MSSRILHAALVGGAVFVAMFSPVQAKMRLIGTIAIPGQKLDSYDISWVDQATGRYFLADRNNKSIDVFDAKTSVFLGRATGFVGFAGSNLTAGPNGVATVNNGAEAWAGDGDSTVKVVDLKKMAVVDTIKTGGTTRADEVAFDPRDSVFIVANDAEKPPYLTLISTKPGHKILGKVVIEDATGGIEQPQYNPTDGMFHVDIPELKGVKTNGALAVIDPKTAKLVKMIPVSDCIPHGQAVGVGGMTFLGCNAGSKRSGLPGQLSIVDTKGGKVAAVVTGPGGSDESSVDNKAGLYYSALGTNADGPVLSVVDAKTNKLLELVPTGAGSHSVAAYEANHRVFVPSGTTADGPGPCGGCILVFAPEQ